jgi:hypothetical protein
MASVSEIIANAVAGSPAPAPAPAPDPTPAPAPAVEPVQSDDESGIPADLFQEVVEPKTPVEPALTPEEAALKKAMESDDPPKEGKAWGALKAKLKEYEKQLEELKSKPAEIPAEKLSEYEKRIAEKDELVAKLSLEHSDKFKREYDQPIIQGLSRAAQMAEVHAGKTKEEAQAVIQRAARMPFADRKRFLNDELPEVAAEISTMLLGVDERVAVRNEALQNAKATQVALQESQSHVQQVQSIRTLEANLDKAITELATAGNIFFKKSGKKDAIGEAWNQAVDLRAQAVKQALLNNKPEEITRLVAAGFAASELQKELARTNEKLAKAREELKGIAAQRPSVNGREPGKTDPKEDLKGLTVEQIVAKQFEGWKG